MFAHYFTETGARYNVGEPWLKRLQFNFKLQASMNDPTLESMFRINFVLDHIYHLSEPEEVHHFYPQVFFINYDYFEDLEVIQMDQITSIFGVGIENKTEYTHEIELTKYQEECIMGLYQDDYHFFQKYLI